jgi:hypothetical protein
VDQWRASNKRPVDAEFYRGVFTRDHSGAAEPMLGEVIAAKSCVRRLGADGTYLDMVTKLPLVDPEKVQCPVLIVRAEHDGIATDEDILGFYSKLPNPDKQLSKISGLAHTAMLGINRGRSCTRCTRSCRCRPRRAQGRAPALITACGSSGAPRSMRIVVMPESSSKLRLTTRNVTWWFPP